VVQLIAIDPGGPDAVFDAWSDVLLTAAMDSLGDAHSSRTAQERRVLLRDPGRRTAAFATHDDEGRLVGAGWVAMPLHDNLRQVMVDLAVLPGHRGHGHGTALLEHAELLAADAGRDLLVAETQWAADGEDASGGFARRFGYEAAQTSLRGSLTLPADRERLVALVAAHEGDGYRLATSTGGIPDEWLDARAELGRRMSLDAPAGDLLLEEEVWDADRVRAEYAQIVASGRTSVDTFAFTADGSAAGYTQTSISTTGIVYQRDTLVVPEHRGHRIGLRLKAVNTLAVMERSPDSRTVRTWNAEENTPMRDVNRELGYVVDACLREWQKVLR